MAVEWSSRRNRSRLPRCKPRQMLIRGNALGAGAETGGSKAVILLRMETGIVAESVATAGSHCYAQLRLRGEPCFSVRDRNTVVSVNAKPSMFGMKSNTEHICCTDSLVW